MPFSANQNHEVRELVNSRTIIDTVIVQNVYRIKVDIVDSKVIGTGGGLGSGFTVFRENEVYLVTAAHLFEGIYEDDVPNSIFIQFENEWKRVQTKSHHVGDCYSPEFDIAVFKVEGASLCRNFNYNQQSPICDHIIESYETVSIGQQIVFAGYPSLNEQVSYLEEEQGGFFDGFPLPFLKFGYLSHYTVKPLRMYIDGAPNKGFSGGPIMFRDSNNELRYLGVVSHGDNDMGQGAFMMFCGDMVSVDKIINRLK